MPSSAKRGRDDEGRDDIDSCVLTIPLRNKLQRSDCSDVGSSYNKLMLQGILTAAVPTPTQAQAQAPTHIHTQQHTTPTSNNYNYSDTQTSWWTPTASIPNPTLTPNYRNDDDHNHNTTNRQRNHSSTTFPTPAVPVLATTSDIALLIRELLELCGSNYNTKANATANKDKLWKQTRDKLWLLGEAAYQSEGARDDVGTMGGCLVVTQCLSVAVKAATNMHTATAAVDQSLLSTLLTVQEAACFCLTNLTYRHFANRHRLMAAGGASVLVSVLRYTGPMHRDAAATAATCSTDDSVGGISTSVSSQAVTVLSRTCMVLDNLTASESCQEEIVQAGVMEAVCAILQAFPGARELQFSGCRILGRLAESCQQTGKHQQRQQRQQQQQVQLRAVRANAVVIVARAFERFCQTDAAAARMASAALQCLTALWNDGNSPDT
jgi:hypothetical protein